LTRKVLDFAAILAANLVRIYSSISASAVLAREAFPPSSGAHTGLSCTAYAPNPH